MVQKVLVVDDALMQRQSARRALTGAGFEVVEAVDGVDGLRQLEAHPDVALVFCDLTMPRMSGIEFLEQLAEKGNLKVPVIILTSEMQPETVQEARRLGAKGWLAKPCSAEVLVSTATRFTTGSMAPPEPQP